MTTNKVRRVASWTSGMCVHFCWFMFCVLENWVILLQDVDFRALEDDFM